MQKVIVTKIVTPDFRALRDNFLKYDFGLDFGRKKNPSHQNGVEIQIQLHELVGSLDFFEFQIPNLTAMIAVHFQEETNITVLQWPRKRRPSCKQINVIFLQIMLVLLISDNRIVRPSVGRSSPPSPYFYFDWRSAPPTAGA